MDEPYIRQHLLVDDYLAGALTDQQLAQFEERLLWDQELMEEVAVAEALGKGMRESDLSFSDDTRVVESAGRRKWQSSSRFAVAATVLLASSLTFNLIQSLENSTSVGATPQVLNLIATRSAGPVEVTVEPDTEVIVTIDPIAGFDEYEITLSTANDVQQPISAQAGLRAIPTQPLAISLPGSALSADDYVLVLSGRNSANAEYQRVSEIVFRVRIQP